MGRRRRPGQDDGMHLPRPGRAALAVALSLFFALLAPALAQPSGTGRWRDPGDGAFDLSEFLLDQKGFLPVPILITEPAVGAGGGVVGAFFRESIRERAGAGGDGRMAPPDILVLGAFGTENGTRGAMAGGMLGSADGRLRWRGGVARVDVNLDFYGLGGTGNALAFNLNGLASIQQALLRLGESDVWLGAKWTFLDLDNEFGAGANPSSIDGLVRASRASGLGVGLELDTRDTMFTPSRGMKGALELNIYRPAWGSDTAFEAWRGHLFGYLPLHRSLVAGARVDARGVSGDAPFYMLPFIELRGVPLMRLQDRRTALAEAELRWTFAPRWSLVGFVGAGRVWGSRGTGFSEGTETVARGAGFRYELARRLGLHAGLDFARSTQGDAVYIMVGSAWR
jgi:hypothetical protein